MERIEMNRKSFSAQCWILVLALLLCAGMLLPATGSTSKQSSAPSPSQLTFPTAQDGVNALLAALDNYDAGALMKIFGPDGQDFVASEDPIRDKSTGMAFAALAREKNVLKTDKKDPNRATLIVGNNDWPFPVPLLKKNGKWFFDSKSGRKEILYRRIGTNELDAIRICRGYVEAQHEYASSKHDGFEVNQYAQKIISTSGKQDGLYWENPDGTAGGPIGKAVAQAIAEGYSVDRKSAYHGYYFKILKGQGPAAPLGKLNYVIQGAMIGGFALVAVPADYRVTGVKTFMVSQDGVVYEKDLGPDSLEIAKKMELYNPDLSWKPTNDEWPAAVETASGK